MIAIYMRLSKSDSANEGEWESMSIENQRKQLLDYIEQSPDLKGEIIEYADDGYTGTSFNRPQFNRMIDDAKAGRIETVLVKDLSRLGRDYITAGEYVDTIFPMLTSMLFQLCSVFFLKPLS